MTLWDIIGWLVIGLIAGWIASMVMGRGGYGARGVIFIVTSFFLMSAGLSGDPSEAGGMQDALKWLSNPVNLIVAAGLALFGLFSLVEARFRQINGPPVDRMAASLT